MPYKDPEKKREYDKLWHGSRRDIDRKQSRAWYAAHREFRRKYNKAWYAANSEQDKAHGRAWYALNSERRKEQNKAWRTTHSDREKARKKEWRASHPGWSKAWYAANPELGRLYASHRRAREMGAEGHYERSDLEVIWKRQKGKCGWCRSGLTKARGTSLSRTLDHITPLISGGSNWPENLQWLCRSCNAKKQGQDDIAWAQKELGLLFAL
jgi:5-methylcytosine-specific restriction endonuclease McrA